VDGNRVQTSVTASGGSAGTTNMLVDAARSLSQVVAETDGSGNISAVYVRAGDELLEVMRPGPTPGTWTTRFVHHDGLGSVRALSDESGTTTDTRGYEAFGTKNVEAGSDPLAYGFAGEPFQSDSMLAYHRARWMDARVGRFLGMDPEREHPNTPATLHRYMYAAANPTDDVDPSGREYDMQSISAGVEADLVLSTLATAKLTEVATDIVCQIALQSGTPIDPSRCPTIEHFFNYQTEDTHLKVLASGAILSPTYGLVFLTNEIFMSGLDAWNRLAVDARPDGYWDIPSSSITYLAFAGPALPKMDPTGVVRPGGANEWITFPPVPIADAHWVNIGP
jgi:RHS repeat-associated protein